MSVKKYADANGLTEFWAKVKALDDGSSKNIWYGTCATAAGTAAKVVTTDTTDFVLETGSMVRVEMTNANTYNGTATLNVDSTGAKNIARVGTTVTTRYFWSAGEVIDFVYDGTNFVMSGKGAASTTYYGVTKLSSSVSSTSENLAASAKAVKTAYDLANKKADHVELTQAEYDALTQAEKTNGDVYLVTDADPDVPAVNDSVPIGAIQAYGGQTAPYGWLICDGSAIRRDTYSELFDVIGVTYGTGDGSTTFNLPDLRGRVITGVGTCDGVTYSIGEIKNAGLPNITGGFAPWSEGTGINITQPTGAFYAENSSQYGWGTATGRDQDNAYMHFDASRSSNKYGASTTVQSNTTVTNYIIKAKEKTLVTATVPPVITDFIDVFYPVGSYYESSDDSFNPNASWGGTWEITNGGLINGSPQTMTQAYQSSSDITTTSYRDLISFTFTSKTGRIWFFGDATVKTSRYTSGISIMVNGSQKAYQTTNIQSPTRLTAISECEVPINTPITISLRMTSQDTGTTGTCCGYTTSHLFVSDIPVITGYCWHRTA